MKSYPGYRGTSPPNLFVSFNRDELDMEYGNFSKYQDPLDLKNTFVSWEYGFDQERKGLGKIVMINPGVAIEDKLFSWYAALAPRSWTAQEKNYTREELEANVAEVADFYVRWGYQSIPNIGIESSVPFADADVGALSHIHKFRLLNMAYQISDKGDKVITLTLVNMWELYYTDESFVAEERLFTFPLGNEYDTVRDAGDIIQDVIMQLLSAHDKYTGYSNWTSDQFNIIEKDLRQTLRRKGVANEYTRMLPTLETIESLGYPAMVGVFDATQKGSIILLDALKEFYAPFGLVPNYVIEDNEDPTQGSAAIGTPSPNQGTGAPNQGTAVNPTPVDPTTAANDVVASDEYTEEIRINDGTRTDGSPLVMPSNGGSPVPMDTAPYYLLVFKDKAGIAQTQLTSLQFDTVLEQKYFYAVSDAYKSQVQGRAWDLAVDWLAWAATIPDDNSSVDAPLGIRAYAISADLGDPVYASIKLASQSLLSRKQETINALAEANATGNAGIIPSVQADEPYVFSSPQSPPPSRHTIQFASSNLSKDLSNLISYLNDKYFKGTSRYLQVGQLEFASVPEPAKKGIEEAMPNHFPPAGPALWPDDDGILIVADSLKMDSIFKFANFKGNIKSFPIQSNETPTTISLSTGFNNRKDNIITSLNWRMNQGSLFLNIRRSPILVQKLYSVAKRFESEEYRDVVMGTLSLVHSLPATVIGAGREIKDSLPAGLAEEYRGESLLGIENQDDVVDSLAFSRDVVAQALAQAVTMTRHDSATQDTASISPDTKESLVKQVSEDLAFILKEELVHIFFPRVNLEATTAIKSRYTKGGTTAPSPGGTTYDFDYFHYVTKSPLGVLQKTLDKSLSYTEEQSILLQAKIQTLNVFQKLITDIKLEILGVPEMDLWTNEIQNRSVALWVNEPRVPGTYQWLTGVYTISTFTHKIDSSGYKTTLNLVPKLPNTKEEMIKYTVLNIGGED